MRSETFWGTGKTTLFWGAAFVAFMGFGAFQGEDAGLGILLMGVGVIAALLVAVKVPNKLRLEQK